MKISIIRGQNQIGGSIVLIETDNTKVCFDAGINLNENASVEVPQIEGLFCGKRDCDGVFVSHYHSDHVGLLPCLLPDIPIYMGEKAYRIYASAANYRGADTSFTPKFLYDKNEIRLGTTTITPLNCDHSAFDSYMFIVSAEGKTVLYTGDFRANGRLDYSELLAELPDIDAVIIEGTTLSRETVKENIKEETLETIAEGYLKKHSGPAFIIMSAMNIDRLVTTFNAARSTNRLLLEDVYTAQIALAANRDYLSPDKDRQIRVFTTGGDKQYEKLQQYGNAKIGKNEIAKKPFVMCVRPSMKNYLDKLNQVLSFDDGVLFFAMWKGYLEQPDMQDFIRFMENKGVKVHILHTSGHADALTLDRLIEAANPKVIIPIHTENSKWFEKYSGKCQVICNEKNIYI